jgi:hypothetical protein
MLKFYFIIINWKGRSDNHLIDIFKSLIACTGGKIHLVSILNLCKMKPRPNTFSKDKLEILYRYSPVRYGEKRLSGVAAFCILWRSLSWI